MKKKHILIYSSVSGAAFWRRMVQELQKAGYFVEVVTALSDMEYRRGRTGFSGRLSVRLNTYFGYLLPVARHARMLENSSETVHIVTTNPFYLPAVVSLLVGKRGGRVIALMYDIFPDALFASGTVKHHGFITNIIAAITRFIIKKADATVFLGDRLREFAEHQYGNARIGTVIPVGADGKPFHLHAPVKLQQSDRVKILYSGNMGHRHDIETLIQFFNKKENTYNFGRLQFIFHASGGEYNNLQQRCREMPETLITWGGALDDQEWVEVMRNSHVALVTMRPGTEKVVMPSKTYSALVAGQAILAVCPTDSDLARTVLAHNCGWVVEPGDVAGLHAAVNDILHNQENLYAKRMNAYRTGHDVYDMQHVIDRWVELIADIYESDINDIRKDVSVKSGGMQVTV